MAYEYEGRNPRSHQRDMEEIRREILQKRAQAKRLVAFCAVLTVCLLVLVVIVARSVQQDATASDPGTSAPSTAPTETTLPTDPTQPLEPETVINLVFGGDLNITDKVVAAGINGSDYDYTELLMDVAPLLAQADAAFLNLEGRFSGVPYGTDTASAPQALADALAAAGVDFMQLANSYTISGGLTGLSATTNAIRNAGMRPTGVFLSDEQRQESQGVNIVNIGGIRVAIVAFTKGLDGMSLPAGSEGCVNLLYTDYATTYQTVDKDGIRKVLQAAAAQKPDVTIALVHWGSEYNDSISPSQDAIVTIMQEEGVDAIVGTHPHFVQPIRYDAQAGTVIAYSLGDFLGDAEKSGTNYSILLNLQITRDNRTGETKITGCDYTGLYVLTPENDQQPMQVIRIEAAMAMYESDHIHKVSSLTYTNIRYAWERIAVRTVYQEKT